MKKKEMREVTITYCDECGKEINDNSHTIINYPDGNRLDFHSTYTSKISETCLDKYKEKHYGIRK